MKTTTTLLLVATFFITSVTFSFSQDVDINWSDKQLYDNKLDGFFDGFIGYNSKYIYTKFNKLGRKSDSKIKLVAFDKNSMAKESDVAVIGYKQNQATAKNYQGLEYYKTIVFENIVYIFWVKNSSKKDELFVQTYDEKLNELKPLKKIYELGSEDKKAKASDIFVLGNRKSNERIIIGGELPAKKGESIKVEFKVLNSDFSFAAAHQVTLPVMLTGKSYGLSSSYEFGDDGNLYIKTYVSTSKEEIKNAKANKDPIVYRYPILTIVDISSGKSVPFEIKADNKNIFNFDYRVDKNSIKIFGFFCDFKKDPKGNDTHGIFYSTIDNKTFAMQNINFTDFTKQQLDKLFAKDIEDRKDKASKMRSKKKQDS